MKKMLLLCSLIVCLLTTLPFAQTSYSSASEDISEENALARLVEFHRQLKAVESPKITETVTAHKNPTQVLTAVLQFKKYVDELPDHLSELKNSFLVQEFFIDAFNLLLIGRETNSTKTNGWYIGNSQGKTGVKEMKAMIDLGVFDSIGYKLISGSLSDFSKGKINNKIIENLRKKDQAYGQDTKTLRELREKIQEGSTNPRKNYYFKHLNQGLAEAFFRPVDELLPIIYQGDAKTNLHEKQAILKYFRRDFYSESVNHIHLSGSVRKTIGRDDEVRRMLEVFNSKSGVKHIALTAPVGVGRSRLISDFQAKMLQGNFSDNVDNKYFVFELDLFGSGEQNTKQIAFAEELAIMSNHKVVLVLRNADKLDAKGQAFFKSLIQKSEEVDTGLRFIITANTKDSKKLFADEGFSRHFAKINLESLSIEDSKKVIKELELPVWKYYYQPLKGITEEALDFAVKYFTYTHGEVGNSTGLTNFLNGAINHRLVKDGQESFTLDVADLRSYLRDNLGMELIPGDPEFEQKFENLWQLFEADYKGQKALKTQLKEDFHKFFSTLNPDMMLSRTLHGPPGSGKSYLAEVMAKTFFGGSVLEINGMDLSERQQGLAKIQGSAPGYVGSDKDLSLLTQFFRENPKGGVILLEEADYVHNSIMKLFVNMITSKEFVDGVGNRFDTSRYVIMMNTNKGQEYLVPSGTKEKMNWEQYNIRRAALTEKVKVDGEVLDIVKKDKIESAFEAFMKEVLNDPQSPGGSVAEEAQKLKRRIKGYYVMGPSKEELIDVALYQTRKKLATMELEQGIVAKISDEDILKIVDIEEFEFEKGYSYISEQLDDKIFKYLRKNMSQINGEVKLEYLENKEQSSLLIKSSEKEIKIDYPEKFLGESNPWSDSPEMKERIKNFAQRMSENLKGNEKQIMEVKELLKAKQNNWDTRVVITQLGTTGNGKTEYFKSMAKALFDDESALIELRDINSVRDLDNFFRPAKGTLGATEETEFEKRVKTRMHSGGGIILLDELLTFDPKNPRAIANVNEILDSLHSLLDEGKLRFGDEVIDGRGFVIGITGNSLKEFFNGLDDSPEAEKLVRRLIQETTDDDKRKYFTGLGIGDEKYTRFGKVFLNGPLPQVHVREIAKLKIKKYAKSLSKTKGRKVEILIPDELIFRIAKEVSSVTGGMRKVDGAFQDILYSSIGGFFTDLDDVEINSIEAKYENDKITWLVNNKEVFLGSKELTDDLSEKNWVFKKGASKSLKDETPQIEKIIVEPKLIQTPKAEYVTAVHELKGHLMFNMMLTGKNSSSFVSIVPGDGYLGYVRHKDDKIYDEKTIVTIFEEILRLQAGYRAPIVVDDIVATGGGSSVKDVLGDESNSDLAKVYRNIDKIIGNNLVDGISAKMEEKEQQRFQRMLVKLSVAVTDRIVEYGESEKIYDELVGKLLEQKILDEEYLDEFAKKHQKNLQKQRLQITDIILKEMKKFEETLDDEVEKKMFRSFHQNFVRSLHGEARLGERLDSGIKRVKPRVRVEQGKKSCASILNSLT